MKLRGRLFRYIKRERIYHQHIHTTRNVKGKIQAEKNDINENNEFIQRKKEYRK